MALAGSAPPLRTVTSAQVAEHAGLVRHVLNGLIRKHQLSPELEREDLEQVGMLAVWEALRRYQPEKGTKVSTYVSAYIWGHVMHHQRETTKATGWHREHGRLAHVSSYEAALEEAGGISEQHATDDTQDEALWAATLTAMRATVRQLPAYQQPAGIAAIEDRSLAEVAREMGVNRQSAYNHRAAAFRALRQLVA